MKIGVTRVSKTSDIYKRFQAARERGLIAGGNVIRNAVRRKLRGGYRSSLGNRGDFVTGNSLAHVTLSEPKVGPDGGSITIGTDLKYNLYWEVGHHNVFTRNFERDEKWAPAFRESWLEARAAYVRVFHKTLFGL